MERKKLLLLIGGVMAFGVIIYYVLPLLMLRFMYDAMFTAHPDLKHPSSCEQDSDCVGIMHPAGAPMCIGIHWMEQGGDELAEIDESVRCKCVQDFTASFIGLNKICNFA